MLVSGQADKVETYVTGGEGGHPVSTDEDVGDEHLHEKDGRWVRQAVGLAHRCGTGAAECKLLVVATADILYCGTDEHPVASCVLMTGQAEPLDTEYGVWRGDQF